MFYAFLAIPALLAQILGSYISVPGDLSISYTAGDAAPTQVLLKVTNIGAQAALFAATSDQPWLSVFLDEPSATEVLLRGGLDVDFTVRTDPAGFVPGVYRGVITLRAQDISTGAVYDTQKVTVALAVQERVSTTAGEILPEPAPQPSPSATAGTATPAPTPKIEEPVIIKVPGIARTYDGLPVEAFIWAWSDKGKTGSSRSARDGTFEMELDRKDRWHLGASAEIHNVLEKSSEVLIDTAVPLVSPVELVLSALGTQLLPEAVRVTRLAEERIIVKVSDGAEVSIPPLAARQEGTVSVEIKPLGEAPSQKGARIVSTVYDITLKDEGGGDIKALGQDVEITLPYREQDLSTQGTSESRIAPAYFDTLKHAWIRITPFRIYKEKKVVRFFTRHLTRFALVAPADTQPPDAPSGIEVKESLAGFVLRWQNPTYDFHHAKIYRSRALNKIGVLVADNIKDATKENKFNKEVGKVYYYVVRAIDLAGNESLNTKQVSARAGSEAVETPSPQPTSTPTASPSVAPTPLPELPSWTPSASPMPAEKPKGFFFRVWQKVWSFFRRMP